MKKTYSELKKWDFELEPKAIAGTLYENLFKNFFDNSKNSITFEVKSELKQSYMVTSNVYIEIYQNRNGKWEPSGLSATTSDMWIHVLKGTTQEDLCAALVIPTTKLKQRLRYLFDNGYAKLVTKPKTNDGHETKGMIVDPRHLLITDDEVEEFNKNRTKTILQKNKIK
jgi:hypothetical protein